MSDLANRRCVVFGGGGFLGTNLCRSLVDKVEVLKAFGRRQSFPDAMKKIEWIPGDFTDSSTVAAAVAGCDTVFHLVTASTPASSNVDKIEDLQANVVSTLHLLEACREERVRRVVFVSSGGTVYGIPSIVPTPENASLDPITAYGISKLATEKYLALYEHLYGIDFRILRVANPYGPFQTSIRNQGVIAAFLHRALEGKPIELWGDGSVTRDYIYVDDVVDALEAAAVHTGHERVFNIGSGEGRSLLEIVDVIQKQLNVELDIRHFEARKADVPCSILDISRAEKDLHWKPKTPFLEGVARTIEWMQLQKKS